MDAGVRAPATLEALRRNARPGGAAVGQALGEPRIVAVQEHGGVAAQAVNLEKAGVSHPGRSLSPCGARAAARTYSAAVCRSVSYRHTVVSSQGTNRTRGQRSKRMFPVAASRRHALRMSTAPPLPLGREQAGQLRLRNARREEGGPEGLGSVVRVAGARPECQDGDCLQYGGPAVDVGGAAWRMGRQQFPAEGSPGASRRLAPQRCDRLRPEGGDIADEAHEIELRGRAHCRRRLPKRSRRTRRAGRQKRSPRVGAVPGRRGWPAPGRAGGGSPNTDWCRAPRSADPPPSR